MDKLKLLDLGKHFTVEKLENGYNIRNNNSNLEAVIDNFNAITYYLTGIYDSGTDSEEIDVEELIKLKEFCELMIED